jgi:predicted AAA+ superfamily ATPase
MRSIIAKSERAIEEVQTNYIRPHISWLDQNERLIGILGSRGVGKTTLLLQYLKTKLNTSTAIYLSMDDLYFTENSLSDFVDSFVKNGGTHVFLDEVHNYPTWSIEIKNLYDQHKKLKLVYTGSSLLKIKKGRADLSRRSVVYNLPGLSLREYINITENTDFPAYSLGKILSQHPKISKTIWTRTLPIKKYNEYIKSGYYPFFIENSVNYLKKLNATILEVLETDLPYIAGINYHNINKIKQLLYIISESVPFKPNLTKLSERIGISKNTLKDYLIYIREALLINSLYAESKGISKLSKPEKIYLYHPNLMHALNTDNTNTGNLRESFFLNQVSQHHDVYYPGKGDFLVDGQVFEIGGKNKTHTQIKNMDNAWLALDEIETGYKREIPLWLFGFLY